MTNPVRLYAELNETIKGVAHTCERLYLMAFNALFVSRQAGGQALGFVRVTTELRAFSQALNRRMETLLRQVDELVRLASELQRQQRLCRLEQAAAAAAASQHPSVRDFANRSRRERAGRQERVDKAELHFRSRLEDAIRHCAVGENLAVLAQMEAAADGHHAGERLYQVADEVSHIVADIQALLLSARRRLNRLTD